MTKRIFYNIGVGLIILGIIMAVLGISMFGYQGNGLSPFISTLGKYSFLLFFETILIGGACVGLSKLLHKR